MFQDVLRNTGSGAFRIVSRLLNFVVGKNITGHIVRFLLLVHLGLLALTYHSIQWMWGSLKTNTKSPGNEVNASWPPGWGWAIVGLLVLWFVIRRVRRRALTARASDANRPCLSGDTARTTETNSAWPWILWALIIGGPIFFAAHDFFSDYKNMGGALPSRGPIQLTRSGSVIAPIGKATYLIPPCQNDPNTCWSTTVERSPMASTAFHYGSHENLDVMLGFESGTMLVVQHRAEPTPAWFNQHQGPNHRVVWFRFRNPGSELTSIAVYSR